MRSQFLLFVTFLVAHLLLAECYAIEASDTGRSAIWDSMLHHLRERRQTVNTWQEGEYYFDNNRRLQTRSTCTLGNLLQFDTLGRRSSGHLADPLDQGLCGSCWAFATSSAFTDLRNLAAGQKLSDEISPDYIARCTDAASNNNGCCGGDIYLAASHFVRVGAATSQCLPYSLRLYFPLTIAKLSKEEKVSYKQSNPISCPQNCIDGTSYNLANFQLMDLKTSKPVSDVAIMNHLRNVGPVVVEMQADMTFSSYLCGVYVHNSNTPFSDSLHAVEIVDFGTVSIDGTNIDFWVVKNSWGQNWGENGYFRVRRQDLKIGSLKTVFQYNDPPTELIANSASSSLTCAAMEINDVQNNVFAKSAATYGLQNLLSRGLLQCRDGSMATDATLISITRATVQTINGHMVHVTVSANVQGCTEISNPVNIDMVVYIDPDGDFSLTEYNYNLSSGVAGITIPIIYLAVFVSCTLIIVMKC